MRRWSSRRQKRSKFKQVNPLERIENFLIRTVVLATVFLVLAQMGMGLAKDPVNFYLSVAQNIEAPSLDSTPVSVTVTPKLIRENPPQTYQLVLQGIPAAPVQVVQNDKVLGTLAQGQLEVAVEEGDLYLDGSYVNGLVQVNIIATSKELSEPQINQVLLVEGNVITLRVAK
ncbi:MAG: hypothetical protein GX958_08165 [Desulfitobacterium sp.]|nr:hypothetical protein [Desulfitobacterium sp.]